MIKPGITRVCGVVVLSFLLTASLLSYAAAAESRGEQAVEKQLEKDIGMPILDGELWTKMSNESKAAFVWGVWHVVSIEHYLMEKYPDLKRENFSAKLIEGSSAKPMTMDEVIVLIDKYYQANPDEIEKPVVGVIWGSIIRPNVTTGIAGRPLKKR
jgi:hypothetical protein